MSPRDREGVSIVDGDRVMISVLGRRQPGVVLDPWTSTGSVKVKLDEPVWIEDRWISVLYRDPSDLLLVTPSNAAPHNFERLGWRWWLCRHCYAPRSLHPRTVWARSRPLGDRRYLAADAPHFSEGW